MKRLCKDIDITDIDFIKCAINECFKNKSSDRRDMVRIINEFGDIDSLANQIQHEIVTRNLILKPIWYSDRLEPRVNKVRHIAIQDIKQQIYDYIAVMALAPLMKRIGLYQCSSIEGRGQTYCLAAVKDGVEKSKYFYKGDVRKYFQSVNQNMIMDFLIKRVKNENLIWLIDTLLKTFESGLAIGSYLSQNLANLYMSILYHKLYEDCYDIRHTKTGEGIRVNYVNMAVFYMDDFVIFTNSKKGLEKIDLVVKETLAGMGLELKKEPQIAKTSEQPVDMVGFRIWKDHVDIRKRTFLAILRAYRRFEKKPNSLRLARRVVSYWGYLKYSDSYTVVHKYNMDKLHKQAKKVVSYYEKLEDNFGFQNGSCACDS